MSTPRWKPFAGALARFSALLMLAGAAAGCGEKKADSDAGAKPLIVIIRAADWMGHEWSEDAIRLGLSELNLEDGRDYEMRITSAQGDLTALPNLVDQARDQKAKVIVALQDPTLQVAVQRVKDIPVVFHLLANPFAVGAGTTDTDHLPNFTGVYSPGFGDPEQERRVALIHRILPKATRLGILFSADEPYAVELKDKMTASAAKIGITVEAQGISNVGEAAQATQALVAKGVDAIEIYGNAPHSAFESVLQAAKAAKIGVFSSSPFEVMKGAVAAMYPDFQEGGVEAGKMVGRILKGESPAGIPFFRVETTKTVVNPNAGVAVPAEVTSEANQVVGDTPKP